MKVNNLQISYSKGMFKSGADPFHHASVGGTRFRGPRLIGVEGNQGTSNFTGPGGANFFALNISTGGRFLGWADIATGSDTSLSSGNRAISQCWGNPPGDSSVNFRYKQYAYPEGFSLDFGNLQQDRSAGTGMTDGQRGLYSNGEPNPGITTRDFFSLTHTGNAIDFNEDTHNRYGVRSGNDGSHSAVCGGYSGGATNSMSKTNMQTMASSSDFGELSFNSYAGAGADTHFGGRGFHFGGGWPTGSDTVNVYNIQSASGGGTDFGEIGRTFIACGFGNDGSRAVLWQGNASTVDPGPGIYDTMKFFNMNVLSDAVDFGWCQRGHRGLDSPSG